MISLSVMTTSCARPASQFQNELKQGIAARENAKYEIAIAHLKRAVEIKPGSVEAHYLLARTYDDNHNFEYGIDKWAELAIAEYSKTIELDPGHLEATRSLAYLYFNGARWDESERYYRKALQVNPKDIQAIYSLGYLFWTRSYQARMGAKNSAKIKPEKSFIASPKCAAIRDKNLDRVNEGITLLTRWPEVASDRDVQIITNLLYRERADIQCNDPKASKADRVIADRRVDQVLERYCSERSSVSHSYPIAVPAAPPPPPGDKRGLCAQ